MEVIHDEDKKMFYYEKDGKIICELTYVYGGEGRIAINHTFVEPEYRGQGLAGELALEIAKYARENNYKIIPVCSFAVSFFKYHKEYSDLIV